MKFEEVKIVFPKPQNMLVSFLYWCLLMIQNSLAAKLAIKQKSKEMEDISVIFLDIS